MPRFHVELSATALVTGSLTVVADSPEDAENEARKRLGDVLWHYAELDGNPVDITEVTEDS